MGGNSSTQSRQPIVTNPHIPNFLEFTPRSLQIIQNNPASLRTSFEVWVGPCAAALEDNYNNHFNLGREAEALGDKFKKDADVIMCLIVHGLQELDERFNPCKLVGTGSYYEKTILGVAREFEYMINLQGLANCIRSMEEKEPGFMDLQFRQHGFVTSGMLNKLCGKDSIFTAHVKNILAANLGMLPSEWKLHNDEQMHAEAVETDGHRLMIHFKYKLPNGKEIPIKINCVLAVQLPRKPRQIDILDRLPICHPNFKMIERVLGERSIYCVITETGEFQITTADVEVLLFQLLPDEIRHCYLLLKALEENMTETVFSLGRHPYKSMKGEYLKYIFLEEWLRFPENRQWRHPAAIPPEDSGEEDLRGYRLLAALVRWYRALESSQLQHVFMSTWNVLANECDVDDDGIYLFLQMNYGGAEREDNAKGKEYRATLAHIERIDTRKADEVYRFPVPGHPFASKITPSDWIFVDTNFAVGKKYNFLTSEGGTFKLTLRKGGAHLSTQGSGLGCFG